MTLPVPNLDDRTFDQLTAEARSLIPKNFPLWTDHNLSDPGITLLELFAFLLEIAIYQTNRVPERSLEHFAKLLGVMRLPGEPIEQTLRRAIAALKRKHRAITQAEFERLATDEFNNSAQPPPPVFVARAKIIVKVEDTPNVFPDEQFVQAIVVPDTPDSPKPIPTKELRQQIFEFLRSRRLITTRVQVVEPEYTPVSIAVTVVRDFSSRFAKDTQPSVAQAIRDFLSPFTGGVDRTGWEFGRSVFRSELYQVIEGVSGVDRVQRLLLNGDEIIGEFPLSSPTSLVTLGEDNPIVIVVDA